MDYQFKKLWCEDTPIKWQKECRVELNKIIKAYNDWQIYYPFNEDKTRELYALIQYGKQTIGLCIGSGCLEELDDMQKFVLKFM